MSEQKFGAKVIEGHRITIPTRIRTRLDIGIGDEVDVVITKAKIAEES